MEAREANAGYPPFRDFVDFISREAELACDPVSSIKALKSAEGEKPRRTRQYKQRH